MILLKKIKKFNIKRRDENISLHFIKKIFKSLILITKKRIRKKW
jgi:hypothetical protein